MKSAIGAALASGWGAKPITGVSPDSRWPRKQYPGRPPGTWPWHQSHSTTVLLIMLILMETILQTLASISSFAPNHSCPCQRN